MDELTKTSYGSEHIHRTLGRIMVICSHPHDGGTLIIERQDTSDPDDDDLVLDTCERSDLGPALPTSEWPFLGFTSRERSNENSRVWGAKHGFTQTPEGSGQWFYADGTRVPTDVWSAAHAEDYPK